MSDKMLRHLTHPFRLFFTCLILSVSAFAQTTSFSTDWGFTRGTFTKTTKIVDGERVAEGPFSYNGTDVSPSKMIVKGNFKAGVYDGPFSMSWTFPKDGYAFIATGKFIKDTLDGVWNFKVKGAVEGRTMDRNYVLTFKRGMLIKGEINNLLAKTSERFATDDRGFLHGPLVRREQENGYLVENTYQYVHGILVAQQKKDVSSGSALKVSAISVDTSVVNNKNYRASSQTFQKGSEIYELRESGTKYNELFTNRMDLWLFKRGGYNEGWAPFLNIGLIRFPMGATVKKKE